MMIFHIISLIWNIAFTINFLDFLASGMMGFYYFKEDANTTECFWFKYYYILFNFIYKGIH